MGYNVYITRADFNAENDGRWITAKEWCQYIEQDPELSLDGVNGETIASWTGPCTCEDPWLDWFEGNVYTKYPDPPLILKIEQIAEALSARVQGDDGEFYRGGEQILEEPACGHKPWWKRLFGG